MKLGILITSIGNFGQKGFYNAQEIGLAKELDKLVEKVVVYKAVPLSEKGGVSIIGDNAELHLVPVKSRGINGLWDCMVMDSALDALLFFSDTQLSVPSVYSWCRRNGIKMYPYIGAVESHSTSRLKRFMIDLLFWRNVRVYKKCTCFVKTSAVKASLESLGVRQCFVAPVGLDTSLLHETWKDYPAGDLKKKYGYKEEDRILLFVGRMTPEKEPFLMLDLFRKAYALDTRFRLLMVGQGELLNDIKRGVSDCGNLVKFIDKIPNKDIWELYRIADAFVNLNKREIFGMAILEAMYYGCKVVAWEAPGPDSIVENGVSGCLVSSEKEAVDRICNGRIDSYNAHKRIVENFTWEQVAGKILKKIMDPTGSGEMSL